MLLDWRVVVGEKINIKIPVSLITTSFFFVVHLIDMNYVITVMPTGICVKVVSSNECIVINISFFSSEMNS